MGPTPKSRGSGASASEDLLELGRISGVFGVRGEVRLFLHNRDSDLLDDPRTVLMKGPGGESREIRLRARPGAGGRIIGRIDGLTSREEAAALKDWTLWIPRAQLPKLDDDEFYIHMVLGAEVVVDGVVVGTVKQVHSTGPNEIFEVRLAAGGVGYVPVLGSHVLEIDADTPRVVLAPDALAVDR